MLLPILAQTCTKCMKTCFYVSFRRIGLLLEGQEAFIGKVNWFILLCLCEFNIEKHNGKRETTMCSVRIFCDSTGQWMLAQQWQCMFTFPNVSLVIACQRNAAQRRGSCVFESVNNTEWYAVSFSEDAPAVWLKAVVLIWLFTESQLCYDLIGWGHGRNRAQKRHLTSNTSFMNFMTCGDHFKGSV